MNLFDFAAKATGGLVTNDRGNGSGGPGYVDEAALFRLRTGAEFDELDAEMVVNEVTESEDPEAWSLAREAFAAQDVAGEPEAVAVSVPSSNDPSAYTLILAR